MVRAYCAGEPGQKTPVLWTILHRIEEFDRIEAICAKGKDPTCQRVQYDDLGVTYCLPHLFAGSIGLLGTLSSTPDLFSSIIS